MFVTIWAFSLVFIHLLIVALEAYLVLAIARVKVFFLLLERNFADVADVLPFSDNLNRLFFLAVLFFVVLAELFSSEPTLILIVFGCILLLLFCGIVVDVELIVVCFAITFILWLFLIRIQIILPVFVVLVLGSSALIIIKVLSGRVILIVVALMISLILVTIILVVTWRIIIIWVVITRVVRFSRIIVLSHIFLLLHPFC